MSYENKEHSICGAALLYQKVDRDELISKVFSVIIPSYEGDDEFDLKARAERYYSDNNELKSFNLVAWHFSTLYE